MSALQIWSIIISIVFSSIRAQGFGIHYVNSFMAEISQLVRFSYVDDCDMVQSDDDVEATHSQMQLAISEFEDLIGITGGFLAQDKNAWHLVDYKCRRGK